MNKLFTLLLVGCTVHMPATQVLSQPHKKAVSPTKITFEPTASNAIWWVNVLWANGEDITHRELPDSEEIYVLHADLESHYGVLDVEEVDFHTVYRLFVDLRDPSLPVDAIYDCDQTAWTLLATSATQKRQWPHKIELQQGNVCGR